MKQKPALRGFSEATKPAFQGGFRDGPRRLKAKMVILSLMIRNKLESHQTARIHRRAGLPAAHNLMKRRRAERVAGGFLKSRRITRRKKT
jgi:hypothetical protein